MNTDNEKQYVVFLNGRPMGITGSKSTVDIFLRQHPGGTYSEYGCYTDAKKEFDEWVSANKMKFEYDDGGRLAAGYRGIAPGDCAVRAIAIATGVPYQEVFDAINDLAKYERTGKRKKRKSNSHTGVFPVTERRYMKTLGWTWVPTMGIGTGCRVHLRKGELPQGRLVVQVTKHLTAVIDGVIHDNHDCGRDGTRCVYGYYIKN